MAVFTLTLVRHGETVANKERVIQGQKDTVLSAKGLHQAELIGHRLQQERFTHVFSSDLQRAFKTCQVILEHNRVTNCRIQQDTRLRERRFGQFEGRPVIEFREAAKKANIPVPDFCPYGAENVTELRARGMKFFDDLCQQLRQQAALVNRETCEPVVPKKRRLTGSFSSTGGNSDVFPMEQLQIVQSESLDSAYGHTDSDETSKLRSLSESTSGYSGSITDCTVPLSPILFGSNLSSPCSDTGGNGNSVSMMESPTSASYELIGGTTVSTTPGWSWQYGCPNVSLSPVIEHRVSSISSISSGRNDSFDDFDSIPTLFADVLVVSHGGLLKELISYFVDELNCPLPGGRGEAMRVSPNTGISKFTISLYDDEQPHMTCLLIHDRDHLVGTGLEPLGFSDEHTTTR